MKRAKLFEVNYIYFCILFLSLFGVHGYSLFVLRDVAIFPFIGSVLLQCLFESWLILTASLLIQRYFHKSLFYFFIALSCILVLAHEADFIMTRLMGVSIWFLLHLISYEIGDNFLEMIKSTNISPIIWFLGALGVIAIFACGMVFFHISDRLARRKKLFISQKMLITFCFVPLFLMVICDRVTLNSLSYANYEQLREILPFKTTFFRPVHSVISRKNDLKELKSVNNRIDSIASSKRPSIFLFVIESLREDFITEEIAPNLFKFKQENISFDVAASGGNCSHHSWFTIFHSQFPLRFSKEHIFKTREKGSLAIQAMRDIGYQIHLYSSAELAFYHMDESIFGKRHVLADTYYEFPHGKGVTKAQPDRKAMEQMQLDGIRFEEDGHLFIVFLDATHFGYSWQRENGDLFQPVEDPINYIKAAFNKGSIEKIKNRYRNSINYVDSLIGSFLKCHSDDDSVIIFTGDHGEAFYENGKLFHASNLGNEQIHVPLYYRFGKESALLKSKASKISSHLDIFPTFIDYVTGINPDLFGLEGESIFKLSRWPYTVTSRYNGGRAPFEFCLQSLGGRMILQTHIPDTLKVTSINNKENPIFLEEAKEAFSHLFSQD